MSDDLFSWSPSYGTEVADGYKLRKAQLGDGYVQLAPENMNPSAETWSVIFENIPKTQGYEIRDFLRDHLAKTFLWENPNGKLQRVRCEDGARLKFISASIVTVNCTFVEAFNP